MPGWAMSSSFPSFDCYRRPACQAGRPPFRRCRLAAPSNINYRSCGWRIVISPIFPQDPNSMQQCYADNDPLYRFHQWLANLRVLEVTEIKTVPYVPLSPPFVERLIGAFTPESRDR